MRNAGFTLIEHMITVAVPAVLSVIARAAYKKYMNQGRTVEVISVLGEFHAKEEASRAAHHRYLSTTSGEADNAPARVAHDPVAKTVAALRARSTGLGVSLQRPQLCCSCVAAAGPAGNVTDPNDGPVAGTDGKARFGGAAPGVPWFYLHVPCESDASVAAHRIFTKAMDNVAVYKQNENQ